MPDDPSAAYRCVCSTPGARGEPGAAAPAPSSPGSARTRGAEVDDAVLLERLAALGYV